MQAQNQDLSVGSQLSCNDLISPLLQRSDASLELRVQLPAALWQNLKYRTLFQNQPQSPHPGQHQSPSHESRHPSQR